MRQAIHQSLASGLIFLALLLISPGVDFWIAVVAGVCFGIGAGMLVPTRERARD